MSDRPTAAALAAAAALFLSAVLAAPALAGGGHHGGTTLDDSQADAGCAGVKVRFGSREPLREEQVVTFPGSQPLRLDAHDNGGIRVRGWDRPDTEVTVCKAAVDAEAMAALRVETGKGSLAVRGGDGGGSVAVLLVSAPRGAVLDLDAANGPVSLRDVEGKVTLDVANGPLSVRGFRGDLKGELSNGPVDLRGGSGNVHLRATNGPLSVRLEGKRWEGGVLDASTVNGPLTLTIDPEFESAFRVSGSAHVPLRCKAAACADAVRNARDGEDLLVSRGADPLVRLATTNGPVTVKDASER